MVSLEIPVLIDMALMEGRISPRLNSPFRIQVMTKSVNCLYKGVVLTFEKTGV